MRATALSTLPLAAVAALLTGCGGERTQEEGVEDAQTQIEAIGETAPPSTIAPSQERPAGDTPPVEAAGEPPVEAAPTPSPVEDGVLHVAGLEWVVPSDWTVGAATQIRRAQFSAPAPRDSGLEDGEIVFFHFGPGQGGDVENNLNRWGQSVRTDRGVPAEPAIEVFTVNGVRVTTAVYRGTYMSGMPAGPQTPKENWMLLGAVIEGGPQGMVFARFTAPTDVAMAHREAWEVMMRTIRVSG